MNAVSIQITGEEDLVGARFEGREIARDVGFGAFEQTLVAMAISELGRNMLSACKGGTIKVEAVADGSQKGVRVLAITEGAGTEERDDAPAGAVTAPGGLVAGLAGVQRLVDEFTVSRNDDNSCTVEVLKWLEGRQ